MAIRFRKSKSIGGIRLTANKGSVGMSFGVKGARVSINSKGRVTKSVGLPGTGLYHTSSHTIGGKNRTQAKQNGISNEQRVDVREILNQKYTKRQLEFYSLIFMLLGSLLLFFSAFMLFTGIGFGIVFGLLAALILYYASLYNKALNYKKSTSD